MAFPATSILDNFNRANEGPPPSASWTNVQNGIKVVNNQGESNVAAAGNWSNWNVSTFGPDCEVHATLVTAYSTNLCVRLSSHNTTATGYRLTLGSFLGGVIRVYRENGGTSTQLGADISQVYTAGDKAGIEMVGSVLTIYYNNSGSWVSLGTRTDGTYTAAGFIGCRIYMSGAKQIDDFGGGTLAGGLSIPVAMRTYRNLRT